MSDTTLPLFDGPRKTGRPRKVLVSRAFDASLEAAEHLRREDGALREVGRRLAVQIDQADDDKVLATLAGQFVAVLDRLGMSPKARAQWGMEPPAEEVNPLDDLRSIREARRAAQLDSGQ